MFRPLELFIGLRYTRAKRRSHFISFISLVSIVGIALGVTALITVISVMNGFEKELRERILGMVAHATVSGVGEGLPDWEMAVAAARDVEHVIGAAPYIEREGMLQGTRISGAIIRGVDPALEPSVSEISERIIEGSWGALQPGEYGIVLGRELSLWAGAALGENVLVYAPQTRATPAGVLPQMRRFKVVGIFEAGMQEYDRGMAIVHMQDAGKLFRMQDEVTGVRLKLDDMWKSREVAHDLADIMGGFYRVRDWTQEHTNFFRAIATEKVIMFIILSMIVGVATFNLVSSLMMLVTDKQSDIAILRTLGMRPGTVMGVFMVQGMLIGLVGIAIGTVGGVLLADNVTNVMRFLEGVFGFQMMPADIYYISDLPSDTRASDVLRIVSLSFVLSVIATIYPAWRAARTHPVEALRYE
jgi:lipoprotein-releasing system permease protein